ncbi:PREDICTED: uncharacterized protein LOC108566883 [Nicrophorus vespilloides]|uniref:Uncharacterized protein LOC108566883 n=1 Tax=Nicrophorus vespilloides TaxID=110193 RepID=A0ABM1N6M8_NICVS|nr:PREDICTED: uncharacterized protein LOC108566883 [Nicrophorus vespilloides]
MGSDCEKLDVALSGSSFGCFCQNWLFINKGAHSLFPFALVFAIFFFGDRQLCRGTDLEGLDVWAVAGVVRELGATICLQTWREERSGPGEPWRESIDGRRPIQALWPRQARRRSDGGAQVPDPAAPGHGFRPRERDI